MYSLFAFVLFSLLTDITKQVTVVVKNTEYIGSDSVVVDGKQVNTFLGIPYAQPPIGELRFKKPLPVVEPKKTVKANQWRPACYQNELFKEILIEKKVSEDCLYLNVWSPNNDSEIFDEQILKPVLFWIHGGAYISDSANRDIYKAEQLAAKSDAVVVTINYRLDIFGFLYTGTDEAPGNVGLWDQTMAMEWVIDNIRYFGGDPKKITIIGENAGAFSVGVHLLSPISRNLFQNAILISGSALNYIIGENPETAKDKWLKAAKEVGCTAKEGNFTAKVMKCLRKKSSDDLSQTLLKLSQTMKKEKSTDEITPQVVFGDQFLPKHPLTMLAEGDHKRNVHIMIGHTDDEGGYMLPMIDMSKYALTDPKPITYDEAYGDLKKLTQQLVSAKQIDGEKVAKTYFSSLKSEDSQQILRRTVGIALGDFYITCPTILFAKELVKSDPKSIKIYHYYWTRKVSDTAIPCASWMGACHGTDSHMLFGDPFVNSEQYTDDERDISTKFIKTVSHFANYGKPLAQEDNGEWPSYYLKDDEVIAPYFEFSNKLEPKTKTYVKNLKTKECEKLWKKYIF